MPGTLEINSDIYKALVESFGEETLKKNIDDILLSAVENRLEQFNNEILKFEEKHGIPFVEFEKLWNEDKIKDKFSSEIESDFIDWEMLEMEKKELISVLFKLRKP